MQTGNAGERTDSPLAAYLDGRGQGTKLWKQVLGFPKTPENKCRAIE